MLLGVSFALRKICESLGIFGICLFLCKNIQNMNTNNQYQEDSITPIVDEPNVAYETRGNVFDSQNHVLRVDIHSAVDGEELLNRLRPRIKSLFE